MNEQQFEAVAQIAGYQPVVLVCGTPRQARTAVVKHAGSLLDGQGEVLGMNRREITVVKGALTTRIWIRKVVG